MDGWECEACGDVVARKHYCTDCYSCIDCCDCDDEGLFDADELGLDPEDDEQRKYGRNDDA